MKISVLITTYQRPDFLRKVLDGYAGQVRPADEIVIADDGSGPATRSVIEEYRSKMSVKLIHAWQEHDGIQLSKLRNHGTRPMTGDYIIYTDGDCVPGPYFVSDHERVASRGWFVQGTRMFVGRSAIACFRGDESPFELFKMWQRRDLTKLRWAVRIPGLWLERRHPRKTKSCNLGVFRSDVLRINGWNEDFLGYMRQDTEFCVRLMRAGVRRRDLIFSAVSFHLEHEKHVDPAQLERNNRLLDEATTAPIYTPRGLQSAVEHAFVDDQRVTCQDAA